MVDGWRKSGLREMNVRSMCGQLKRRKDWAADRLYSCNRMMPGSKTQAAASANKTGCSLVAIDTFSRKTSY